MALTLPVYWDEASDSGTKRHVVSPPHTEIHLWDLFVFMAIGSQNDSSPCGSNWVLGGKRTLVFSLFYQALSVQRHQRPTKFSVLEALKEETRDIRYILVWTFGERLSFLGKASPHFFLTHQGNPGFSTQPPGWKEVVLILERRPFRPVPGAWRETRNHNCLVKPTKSPFTRKPSEKTSKLTPNVWVFVRCVRWSWPPRKPFISDPGCDAGGRSEGPLVFFWLFFWVFLEIGVSWILETSFCRMLYEQTSSRLKRKSLFWITTKDARMGSSRIAHLGEGYEVLDLGRVVTNNLQGKAGRPVEELGVGIEG